jgi:UDP-N-acetylmuramoyl-tripeptide--D-alanyl-D-alanine ligase
MILSRNFLLDTLGESKFFYSGKELTLNDDSWKKLEALSEVRVSIDSRTVKPGEFFVALKGPRFDGNDFVVDTLKKGACGVLVSDRFPDCKKLCSSSMYPDRLIIVVSDTLEAFVTLAKAWRRKLACPVVGITGSVGKTTTKEMLRTIFKGAGFDAYVSIKNYNNLIGVSYNLLCASTSHSAVILEMGINETGEMEALADVVRPTIGVILRVAHVHLEGLGNSLAEVAFEKRQIFKFFISKHVGIVCGDQSLLGDVYYSHPISKFGLKTKNQVQARKVTVKQNEAGEFFTSFLFKWYNRKAFVCLKGNHTGFVNNALAAGAISYFLKIPFEFVVQGLENYQGFERRFELKKLRGGRGVLLNDCYNAAPESMKAAIHAFSQIPRKGIKVAVIGDMLELGDREKFWHRQIGRFLRKVLDLDFLILVGNRSKVISRVVPGRLTVLFAKDWKEAKNNLETVLSHNEFGKDALVLVKASFGVRLDLMVEKVVD